MFDVDHIIVFVYLIGVLALGLWAGRGIRKLAQYSVAERSYTSFIIFATLSASFIGGGFTMGNAEKVFTWGIVNIFALWGFSLKEILVASFIAPRMGYFPNAISVGDIMKENFGAAGKVIAGIFGVLLCAGILGAQVGATGYIFEVFLGIPQIWGILIGSGIVIAYATFGGMKSVVYTDILQFFVLGIGIPLTLVLGIIHAGGVEAVQAAVPANHFSLLGDKTAWAFVALFLSFVLGETLVPPYVQRLLLGKDVKHTARGTLWSGIFSIPFFAITGGIGLVALTLKSDLNANLALPYVIETVLPVGVKGFVIAGVISIVMSSGDSFLNAAAVAFSNDVVKPLQKNPMSDRNELLLAKGISLLVGILAIVFAVKIKSILDILLYAYTFWAPVIVVPLAATLLGVKANKWTFLLAAVAGGATTVGYLAKNSGGVEAGIVLGALVNAIVFFLSAFLTKKKQG